MFSIDDTIVAVATPAGRGGVGLVRVSGPAAAAIGGALANRHTPWPARRAVRAAVDAVTLTADALVTWFPGPGSYTGEDVLEVSAHGSPVILAAIVARVVGLGARPARPGEFTLRAFVHGKLDLVQAEAVRDLVEAVSPAQVRAAASHLDGSLSTTLRAIADDLRGLETRLEASMDFPDEGYRFIEPAEVGVGLRALRDRLGRLLSTGARAQLVRDGARVVIAGVPNVGKSTVFNALVGADRAIVTPVPGTTRDLVTERVVLDGALLLLVDTAGLRASADVVEAEGVRRAEGAVDAADLVVLVLDRSRPLDSRERSLLHEVQGRRSIIVANKADLPSAWGDDGVEGALAVCARDGHGIPDLAAAIACAVAAAGGVDESVLVTNERHRALLARAFAHVEHAVAAFAESGERLPEEFVVADLRGALQALEEVTGRRSPEALLEEIFATFCIGK